MVVCLCHQQDVLREILAFLELRQQCILQDHQVNKQRIAQGSSPANVVLLRGCGSRWAVFCQELWVIILVISLLVCTATYCAVTAAWLTPPMACSKSACNIRHDPAFAYATAACREHIYHVTCPSIHILTPDLRVQDSCTNLFRAAWHEGMYGGAHQDHRRPWHVTWH